MKVLEVIPITRSIFAPGTLSYFSIKPVLRGDLVKINLRGKETFAIIEKSGDVAEEKVALKKIGFQLKPLKGLVCEKFFSDSWFRILEKFSRDFIIPQQVILSSILPKAIFSSATPNSYFRDLEDGFPGQEHRKYAIKGSFEDRIDYIRGVVREHFARKKSLMIITPRVDNIGKLKSALERGIEEYVFAFSSGLASKKYLSDFNKAVSEEHPVLILGTPQILFFGRPDLETLVLDEESSRLWKDKGFFSLDFRALAETIAEEKKLNLFFIDQILRVETMYKAERRLIESKNILTGRIQNKMEVKIIEIEKSNNFSWISNDLAREIKESLSRNEKILLLANRKGYSSFTICQDCSRPILCPNCSIPLVLHNAGNTRKFICRHCLKIQTVPDHCQSCGSWKLKDFGLGIEKVAGEFENLFPKTKFTKLEGQRSDIKVSMDRKYQNFENVVIATEIIFSYTEELFDLVAIISIDNLFTIPDFRINETIFHLITALKTRAKRKFILQTRLCENKLIKDAVAGNISEFYRDEIESRKSFGYPPFAKLIKLSRENKNLNSLREEEKNMLLILKDYDAISFPAFKEKLKGLYRWNILLKIPEENSYAEKLRAILENLSPMWHVSIDPESII